MWKHAATFSENNTEIKIWSCETWSCIQTIKFKPSPDTGLPLIFKAKIDRTSSHILLSDMTNRQLYVLEIFRDNNTNGGLNAIFGMSARNGNSLVITENDKKNNFGMLNQLIDSKDSKLVSLGYAFIRSIAEFPLSSSILSFGILNADIRKYKCSDTYLVDELDDYDEESNALFCVVIHMFVVHPKSVQECHVLYQPSLCAKTITGNPPNNDQGKIFKIITTFLTACS